MKLKILVVDDEEGIRSSIADYLKLSFDCEVDLLSNGSEAIKAIDESRYQVLVQDVQMQGIDGITVLRHAKRHNPDLIVFVISKFDDELKVREIERLGGVYLSKPFKLSTLTKLIARKLKIELDNG